jgi:hypothetical protein
MRQEDPEQGKEDITAVVLVVVLIMIWLWRMKLLAVVGVVVLVEVEVEGRLNKLGQRAHTRLVLAAEVVVRVLFTLIHPTLLETK